MFVVYAKGKNHSSAFLHPVQEEKLQNMKKKTLEDLKKHISVEWSLQKVKTKRVKCKKTKLTL
jgi:hypothetical protein